MENNESTQSKYDAALAKYNTNLNDAEVAAEVAGIIAEKVPANNTPEVKKFLFNCIDLTTLNSTDSDESVMKFTQKVNQFDEEFPDLKNVAAICVYPNFAEVVKDTLEVEDVKIACVSAGFPSSQTFIEIKVAETAMAIMEGADEIDIVISVGKFLSGDYETMCDEIQELKATCKEHHLKVILETGALKTAANIKKASILSMYAGADFIKTSTGKQQPAATPEAAYVMCQAIKEYHALTGNKIGFKPAGGINCVNDALIYYTIVKEVLGEEWLNNGLFRLGTSRLANLLLSEIKGEESRTFVDRLHLQDRHDDALSFHVGVGEPHRAHQVGARLFVVADVVRVVDEPHLVGMLVPDPDFGVVCNHSAVNSIMLFSLVNGRSRCGAPSEGMKSLAGTPSAVTGYSPAGGSSL